MKKTIEKQPSSRHGRSMNGARDIIITKKLNRAEGAYVNVYSNLLKKTDPSANVSANIKQGNSQSLLAEMELKKSEDRLKEVFKGFPIPSFVWQHLNDDFVFIAHNKAAELFTQGSIKNYLGEKFSQILENSPNKEEIEADFSKCINERTTINKEMSFRLRSLDNIMELRIWYVFISPDLILVHTEDITDKKITEGELRKLSSAVEQTADSVVITDIKGAIEYVNPAFEKTTGYSREEALGKTPRLLNSGEHNKTFYKKLWKVILSGKTYHGTIINKKKNGELYWSQQTITPMKNKDGRITNFVSVLKDITELRERQEQEFRLQIASELQQRLYKSKISVPGYDIAGKTHSVIETCGDYFDFITMNDGSIGIVIGDVCGHGIGAAMIMVQTRAYLRAFAKLESDPGLILTQLNEELSESLDETHFVTLILARLDPRKNIIEYASAGHIPAYILKNSDVKDVILESTGIPLCVIKDYEYKTSKPIQLSPGDILTFITDGIVETRLSDENEFGSARTIDVVKSFPAATSEQIIEEIYKASRSFAKNKAQEDDITSVICKVNSISGNNR